MPFAVCPQCAHYFVTSGPFSPPLPCHYCAQPLRPALRSQALAHLRQGSEGPAFVRPPSSLRSGGGGEQQRMDAEEDQQAKRAVKARRRRLAARARIRI
jgi:hypothetical protein